MFCVVDWEGVEQIQCNRHYQSSTVFTVVPEI